MPVTIKPADHPARKWDSTQSVDSAESLLKGSSPNEYEKCKTMIRSSFGKFTSESPLYPANNGFVRAAIDAYCSHYHLTLRPEDIWFSILSQLSLYINAHAEELRSFFVAHEGQRELGITAGGNIYTADFGTMARQMSELMNKNVVDPELQPWIMPAFSTTTETDKVVASVIMMGALQAYFDYTFYLVCGIPSVTLLGVRADWEEILQRLEKIPNLGAEAAQFYKLLKPVLTQFVRSFDSPDSLKTKDFWQKIADESGGSGPPYVSGWITAFCFWDDAGKSLYAPNGEPPRPGSAGYISVPVKVDDNGMLYETIMVAGSMGIRVKSTAGVLEDTTAYAVGGAFYYSPSGERIPVGLHPEAPTAESGLDSLQPESGWFMFEKMEKQGDRAGEPGELDLYDNDGMSDLLKPSKARAPPPLSMKFKQRLRKLLAG